MIAEQLQSAGRADDVRRGEVEGAFEKGLGVMHGNEWNPRLAASIQLGCRGQLSINRTDLAAKERKERTEEAKW